MLIAFFPSDVFQWYLKITTCNVQFLQFEIELPVIQFVVCCGELHQLTLQSLVTCLDIVLHRSGVGVDATFDQHGYLFQGGFQCSCKKGYIEDAFGQCVDRDECKTNVTLCPPGSVCRNTPVSDFYASPFLEFLEHEA